MRLLHTSDWHLGRALYGHKRYAEFDAFLTWLADVLEQQQVDALVVAGDIFDTTTPSNRAQELYYRFLCKVAASSTCSHVVIVGGNHDSPSFLNAPRELLRALNVYVIGAAPESAEDEVLVLRNSSGIAQAVVAAVPYLRDRDIRTVEAGETLEDKQAKLIQGIRNHYTNTCAMASNKRAELEERHATKIPLIATGHLFTAGGKTTADDGVRELYVGSLAHVEGSVFPQEIDYLALGHLHVPQRVGGAQHMRYSGAPLPMGFGEADQQKYVMLVDFDGRTPEVETLNVPFFQKLKRIEGSLEQICNAIAELKQQHSNAWLEIEYTGTDIGAALREGVDSALEGSALEMLRIRNRTTMHRVIHRENVEETLDDLNVFQVFERCMDVYGVEGEERTELELLYREVVHKLHEEDPNAA
ncbi:MAG: exonuclease SbcCD subunit D C-terminal domain-containing protein [Thermodesulfobacteriota bacterium]